jgi:hypothetical protein
MTDNSPEQILFTVKKNVLLKLLNKILELGGKGEIKTLTDFNEINRDIIMNDNVKKIIDNMEKELFGVFVKQSSHANKKAKRYTLNCIKSFAKQVDLDFISKKKEITVVIDGESYRKATYLYTISQLSVINTNMAENIEI